MTAFFVSVAPASAQPGEDLDPPADPPADPSGEPPPPEPVPVEPEPGDGPAPVRVQPSTVGTPSFDQTDPSIHAHTGFFGRAILGFGFGAFVVTEDGTEDLTINGLSGTFLLSAGYAIRPRLILHVDLGGIAIPNGSIKLGDVEGDFDTVSATAAGIGAGATYYLGGSNAYLSGSLVLGAASVTIEDAQLPMDLNGESDAGVAVSILGGKEWWVGSDLGVGVVGHIFLGSFPDSDGSNAKVGVASFTLDLSATYN